MVKVEQHAGATVMNSAARAVPFCLLARCRGLCVENNGIMHCMFFTRDTTTVTLLLDREAMALNKGHGKIVRKELNAEDQKRKQYQSRRTKTKGRHSP